MKWMCIKVVSYFLFFLFVVVAFYLFYFCNTSIIERARAHAFFHKYTQHSTVRSLDAIPYGTLNTSYMTYNHNLDYCRYIRKYHILKRMNDMCWCFSIYLHIFTLCMTENFHSINSNKTQKKHFVN